MVLPALAIPIIAGLGGAIGGMGLSQILGGGKKDSTVSTVTHAPYESYAPQQTYAPQMGYNYQGATYIIGSPGATSKKDASVEQTSTPSQSGAWEFPQTTGSSSGLDSNMLIMIALIGGVAVIGYGLVSGGKK